MAVELTGIDPRTIAAGQNVPFTETPIPCNRGFVTHREGSGLVSLKGACQQCRALYKVEFMGNIALPTGGTAGPISVALAIDGEALASATAIVTPAAVNEYFNVAAVAFVSAPRGCCVTVSVQNTSGVPILAQNSNIVVDRIA